MSGLSERVEKLPPDVKNSLNDNDGAMFKGFKYVFPLASSCNCCTQTIAMSVPKKWSECVINDATNIVGFNNDLKKIPLLAYEQYHAIFVE